MSNYTIISENDFQKAREAIKSARKSGKEIIFASNDDELNRKILEREKIDILLIKLEGRKDKLKQRNSGFNQVMAKLALKNSVAIATDICEIENAGSKIEKAKIIARLRQNVELCKKNKLKMVFIRNNSASSGNRSLKALGLVLGMPTWMTKEL